MAVAIKETRLAAIKKTYIVIVATENTIKEAAEKASIAVVKEAALYPDILFF